MMDIRQIRDLVAGIGLLRLRDQYSTLIYLPPPLQGVIIGVPVLFKSLSLPHNLLPFLPKLIFSLQYTAESGVHYSLGLR